MSIQRISIMGCGWLGFALAGRLTDKGHFVRGSTTTKDKIPLLEQAGIEPYYIVLNPTPGGDDLNSFFDVDTVIINIPPPRVSDRTAFMKQQARELVSHINASRTQRVVMVSSTGVYPSRDQEAYESDDHEPETESGHGLLAMESTLQDELQARVAVIRMAGLFGPERKPGRFLAGRNVSGNGEEPVNMIHLEDATGVLAALVEQKELTGVFNACASEHPSRKQFFQTAAKLSGLEPPVFEGSDPRPWKKVNSRKIRLEAGYLFVFDDPLQGLLHC